ncbi:hypothetical protein HYW83_01135 [Candidatus Peregrinibacteria bacterium]|nr:hypothetical protein [Candidatus Peregrinibacteria bacterium]
MEPLRPRFKIQKHRISGPENEKESVDFSPEKVIYVEIDDEITHVFDRLKRLRVKRVALVIPRRAIILQSIVNLKILKKKIDELEKEVVIVTTDLNGMQLALKAGIPAIEKLFEKEPIDAPPPTAALHRGERPLRMSREKVSLSQIIRQEKPTIFSSLINRIKERWKKKKTASQETRLVFIAPNKQALFTLILVSVLLLLAIAYIALPGATIYITPKSTILDPSFNITFLDFDKNRDLIENNSSNNIIVATYLVEPPPFTKKFTHFATGKIFKGENSRGVITVTNLSGNPWDLAARTRFQTQNGLVFRISQPVRVPPARGNIPGTLDVNVTADEFDANGQTIGERGNIPPIKFFLPGLKNPENQKKLYGENKNPMAGGVTRTVKIASQEDITAAKELAKREIAKSATADLQQFLEQQNLVKKTNFSLLLDRHAIKIGEPRIDIPTNLAGKEVDQFEVTASYELRGAAFDRQILIEELKKRLLARSDPDKKIMKIADDDITYKFLDEDTAAGKIRLTATLRAIQAYELDPEKENGHRFIKKITDHILGARVKDAMEYLQQQTDEIARVEITTWPIWAPTIPNIADNVKFVIRDEENGLQ